MIDYRQFDTLYQLKALFDLLLDPVKFKQVSDSLTAQLKEYDIKLGTVNTLDKVKQYEIKAKADIDTKYAQLNSDIASLQVKQAKLDQQQVDYNKQVASTSAALVTKQRELDAQKTSQATVAATLNDRAVALNNLQQSINEQQAQLAKDQKDLADKQAKLKAIMG